MTKPLSDYNISLRFRVCNTAETPRCRLVCNMSDAPQLFLNNELLPSPFLNNAVNMVMLLVVIFHAPRKRIAPA